jgi:hypothetical protein
MKDESVESRHERLLSAVLEMYEGYKGHITPRKDGTVLQRLFYSAIELSKIDEITRTETREVPSHRYEYHFDCSRE